MTTALRVPGAGSGRWRRGAVGMWRRRSASGWLGGYPGERAVPNQAARPGAEASSQVARVGQQAAVQGQAAAPDAFGQAELEPLELGDPLVDLSAPAARQPGPVLARGHTMRREGGELGPDLL